MSEKDEVLSNLILEFRKGTLVLAVLSQLKEAHYGYSLVQKLNQLGLNIDQGTLYPLMRRLEKYELLQSDWNVEESRPRKYYILNDYGKEILEKLTDEWNLMVETMNQLL